MRSYFLQSDASLMQNSTLKTYVIVGYLRSIIWAEESFTVEMNHVRRIRCTPRFALPRQVDKKLPHSCPIGEARDVDKTSGGARKEHLEFSMPLSIYRPMGRGCFHQE